MGSLNTVNKGFDKLFESLLENDSNNKKTLKEETNRDIKLEVGKVCENAGGGQYRCDKVWKDEHGNTIASMTNIKSEWNLIAHGIVMHDDGKIEWDYSTNGKFLDEDIDDRKYYRITYKVAKGIWSATIYKAKTKEEAIEKFQKEYPNTEYEIVEISNREADSMRERGMYIDEKCGKKVGRKNAANKKQMNENWRDEFRDVFEDLKHRVDSNLDDDNQLDDAVWQAIDEGLIYTDDIWVVYRNYCDPGDDIQVAYEQLFNELYSSFEG